MKITKRALQKIIDERDKKIYADWQAGAKVHEIADFYKTTKFLIYNVISRTRKKYQTGVFKSEESEQREINRLKKIAK